MDWVTFLHVCQLEVLRGKPRLRLFRLVKCYFFGDPSRQAVIMLRWAQLLEGTRFKGSLRRNAKRLAKSYGIYLGSSTEIGPGLKIRHPTSIVIGGSLKLGSNLRLYQQVTLAERPEGHDGVMQRVGDNVIIYPGAKFVGNGCVGNNVMVGANAVVTQVFGDNLVLAGAPARVVRQLPDPAGSTHEPLPV